MSFTINRAKLDALPPAERKEVEQQLAELAAALEANPLQGFHACPEFCGVPGCHFPTPDNPKGGHPKQYEFLSAWTSIQAALAGNRFGKTTGLVVKALCQVLPEEFLPERLRPFKLVPKGIPIKGRIVCPDFTENLLGVILPAFDEWTPAAAFYKGSRSKAWSEKARVLRFADGSFIQVMTYDQDLKHFGGAALHFVGYDEPPPIEIREECMMRLIDYDGFEMFTMTPLKANAAWVKKRIYNRRSEPHITVVKGSIHDNPTLSKKAINRTLDEIGDDIWRQAREFGDFVDLGGLVYPRWEECLVDPPDPEHVQGLAQIIVGIDPGLRNAAFTWVGFDKDNAALVFDELLIQGGVPSDYINGIRQVNAKWGLKEVQYIIDPSARNRSLVNRESIQGELQRLGIYPRPGQNDREAGVQQIRDRQAHKRFYVSRECRGLNAEAEEYSVDPDKPDFEPLNARQYHHQDSCRYAVMARPWWPQGDSDPPHRHSYQHGVVEPWEYQQAQTQPCGPMGPHS